MSDGPHRRRPPLWLAAAALASGWAAAYTIAYWILAYLLQYQVHEDFRFIYLAAEAGVRQGWPAIYDQTTLRSLAAAFSGPARVIDASHTYDFPPLVAWLVAPLTVFPEPVAYAFWTAVSAAALVFAWRIAAPFAGLARVSLLLVAMGLWPVLKVFYLGQPSMVLLALVAVAWWLCSHERPLSAGTALALATFLKPQVIVLLPLALAVSGRYRVAAGWLIGCAALAVATVAALGHSGLAAWWSVLSSVQSVPLNYEETAGHLLGLGPATYALWAAQGLAALLIARWRRLELEMVFAAGLLGSAAVAFHFHEYDYSSLVLAGWLILRSAPPVWHRLWLLAGILPMQLMDYWWNAQGQTFWDGATHAPQLIYDAAWLGILLVTSYDRTRIRVPVERPTLAVKRST